MEHGADVNTAMANGKTPLMFAAVFNRLEIIDLLLRYKRTTVRRRKVWRWRWARKTLKLALKNRLKT